MNPHGFTLVDPVVATDHALGSPGARVTLVEYGDFECPNCKQAAGALKILRAHFGADLRLVFRHFPLEEVHPHALQAAEAAECAGGQGRFWEMHDLLFEHQNHLQPKQLIEYAGVLGLDVPRFTGELDDEIFRQRIREHQRGGAASGVHATPTFFINGRIFDASQGMQALRDAIIGELARSSGK